MVRLSTKQQPPKARPDVSAHFTLTPAYLDRLADYELHLGHHITAEHLARKAQALREVGASA